MNLQWLYYFTTIAELEHYTKAADKLRVSQSNLSHAMKDMEHELGAELFERQGRNIKLTKYGQIFLPYAKKTLNTLETGINTLQDYINPNSGTISMSGFYSVEAFASDMIVQYHSETNRLGVQFNYSSQGWDELSKEILDGSIDLIICTKIDAPQIGSTYIGTHPLVAAVPESHPFARKSCVSLKDFAGEKFINFNRNGELNGIISRAFAQRGVKVNSVIETHNDMIIFGLVAAGYGVSIVPYPLSGAPEGTKVIPIAENFNERKLYLQWNTNRYIPPAAEYFKKYIIRCGDVFNQYLEKRGLRPARTSQGIMNGGFSYDEKAGS